MEPFARLPKRVMKDDELPAPARLLYAALDGYLMKKTGRCDPSIGRLANDLGFTQRHVITLLQQLETSGWIAIKRVSGRRNEYELLHASAEDFTREAQFTGEVDFTREAQFTGTREVQFTGEVNSPYKGFQELEKEGRPTPPPDLFADQHANWIASAVEYWIDDAKDPKLDAVKAWFPALVEELFLLKSWRRRTDPRNAFLWAREFARINATQAEVRAAIDWLIASPPLDPSTRRPIFSRDDCRRALLTSIHEQRRRTNRQPTASAPPAEPVPAGQADWRAKLAERSLNPNPR